MSLIIKDKIAQLKKGYPTVSDKYNVQGGVYVGTDALYFGDVLATSGTTGHYVKATAAAARYAGICLATNVKLANRYPGDSNSKVETLTGEAFNLLVRGFVAVAIYNTAYETAKATYEADKTEANKTAMENALANAIEAAGTEGAVVYTTVADGKVVFTTDSTGTALEGAYFMGVAEVVDGEILAEINYKM